MTFKMSDMVIWFLLGISIGFAAGISLTENYYQDASLGSQEECAINKPAGTTCVYEGSWVAKEAEDESFKAY